MEYLVIIAVCFFASVVGSICGIGGGVIIKPVLDATGVMPVTTISFLSGCTVLSMSLISFYKNIKNGKQRRKGDFDVRFAGLLAFGAVLGGVSGKWAYQRVLACLPDRSRVGAIQAFILLLVTLFAFFYTVFKSRIHSRTIQVRPVILLTGILLGLLSAFLGIGGGPINLIALYYLFSMETKQAARYSLFIILFSQLASLLSSLLTRSVPDFPIWILLLMVFCGAMGGAVGSTINAKIPGRTVDKLFRAVLLLIAGICVYNIFLYY